MTSLEQIALILVQRDGMSYADAKELVDETRDEIHETFELGDGALEEVEDILQYNLGLEPDYMMAFI